MISQRQLFLNHVAQTSATPLMLEIERAEGCCLHSVDGKKYIDLISGISVSSVGHRHPKVISAIEEQLRKHLHVMVYGEIIQSPQVKLAEMLTKNLPASLHCVYFVNSGAEATEGAMKLAKRFTGRSEIIAFKNAYHGSTQGALSLVSDENFKVPFRPLLPGISHIEFNNHDDLKNISHKTACAFVEYVQGEAGAVEGNKDFLVALRKKCNETGTLIIADEIQTGYGRTGSLFAFEQYDCVPDILLLAKGMGGGMPLGAFISSKGIMQTLSFNPALGHITTFGGHPVSCAASLAILEIILEMDLKKEVERKEKLFRSLLHHKLIKNISGKGLLLGAEFQNAKTNHEVIVKCLERGLITDWFLFSPNKMRIAPPLIMQDEMIEESCKIILDSCDSVL